MFTILAIVGASVISWQVSRDQTKDPDDIQTNIKHSRQDLRLIAFLLYAVILMLGIIADRIH